MNYGKALKAKRSYESLTLKVMQFQPSKGKQLVPYWPKPEGTFSFLYVRSSVCLSFSVFRTFSAKDREIEMNFDT